MVSDFFYIIGPTADNADRLGDLMLLELDERDKILKEVKMINNELEKTITIIEAIWQFVKDASNQETNS